MFYLFLLYTYYIITIDITIHIIPIFIYDLVEVIKYLYVKTII